MKRKILVFALLLSLVITLIPTTTLMFGTASASPDTGWTLVTNARAMKAYPALREYVWQKNASMAPNGPYDKIGLHRLVIPGASPKGVVVFLPSTCSNGETWSSNPSDSNFTQLENYTQTIYWANRGFDVYSIDYRTHFVPPTLNASQISFMANWGWDQWISDINEAINKAKEVSGSPRVFLVGQGFSGEAAVNYATLYPQDLMGIILVDADMSPTVGRFGNETNSYNLTLATAQMDSSGSWTSQTQNPKEWQYILDNPGAPAQYPPGTPLSPAINPITNKTWTNITEWASFVLYYLYGSAMPGGFSNIYGGYGNITQIAYNLAKMDIYWPKLLSLQDAAILDWVNCPYVTHDFNDQYKNINIPLLAFDSGLLRNTTGTFHFTNGLATPDFTGIMLSKYGKDDVYFGTYSARDVSEPAYQWMINHTIILSSGFEDGFNSWTSTYGGVSVVSSPVYNGSYAMKCSDPWGSLAAKTIGQQSETCTSAEFCFDKNVAGDQTLIGYRNWAGNPTASMGISVQSGRVFVFVQDLLPSYSYSQYELTGFFTPGTWYKFALDVSSTSATIYVNDKQVASLSQTNIPATDSVNVGMFWGNGVYNGNLYIDDVQIGVLPPLALPAGSVRNYWTGGTGTIAVPSSTWPTGGLHQDSLTIYAQHVEGGTYGTGDSITIFVPYPPPFNTLPMACFCTNPADASFEQALRSGTPAGSIPGNTRAVSANDLKVERNGNSVTVELKTQQTIKWMKNASATGGVIDVIIPAFTMKLDTVGDSTHTNTVVQLAGFAGASGYTVYDDNMRFNANGAFTCADWNYTAVPMTNCIFVMHGINTNVPP